MKSKLLLMLLAIALVAGVAQANMLKNPGFEEGSFQTQFSPDNWENYYTSYGQVHTWINNAVGAHSGSKYIRMYNWLVRAPSYVTSAYFGQEVAGIKEGKDYTFSVWAKNGVEDQVRLAEIYVDWLDSAGDWLDTSGWVDIPVTDANWIEIDFGAITAPEGAAGAWVWLANPLGNGVNPIFYDDITMIGADPNITAGADMISWDGETLSLTGTTTLEGYSTITWSAEPYYGAVITDGDTLTPTVDVDCIIPSGPATIANHSFENGLDNWEILGGEGHGTWGGYDEPNDVLTIFITPPDGLMCAYVDGVSDGMGKLSQVLVNTLAANTDYTLSVDVVNDGYYEEDVAYRVQLYAGGSLLAQDNDGQALDTYGEWKTSTVNFSTGDDHVALGEPLEIRLIAKAGTNEMNFDNIVLTANPEFPAHVPDVLGIKLKLDIDGKYDTMKIDTYPDACAAWLAAGLREPTDLVNDECITNVADLAEMVKTWTDHNAFTEPKATETTDMYLDGFASPVLADDDWTYWYYLETPWYIKPGILPTESPWTFTGGSGVAGPSSPWMCDSVSPDPLGDQFAFSQGAATISQDLTGLGLGAVYKINFFEATRTWGGGTPYYNGVGNDLSVIIDEGRPTTEVTIYTSSLVNNITWEPRTTDIFVATEPLHTLTFRTTNPQTGDCATIIDGVTLETVSDMSPSPGHDADIQPVSELELRWVNLDPNKPGDPVYVDVWFGTDPNKLPPPSPTYDFNKIVDATTAAGEDANSVTVDASVERTYYWQVNSYIYGNPTDDPIEGFIWKFHVANDATMSVNAGVDWVTWSGITGKVQLDASIDDDGASDLIIDGWSAVPATGVVFDPNEFVEDPKVTITKVTNNPSVVVLTFSAHDAVSSDEDFLMIYVYDTACLAAIGDEGVEIDTGDFDADCDTDLEDYATLAEEWLVYNELTTSIAKP